MLLPASSLVASFRKNGVGLFVCSCFVATCSAKRLAVSSSVSPASRSFTKCPLHQATTTIPHAKTVERWNGEMVERWNNIRLIVERLTVNRKSFNRLTVNRSTVQPSHKYPPFLLPSQCTKAINAGTFRKCVS